MRCVATKLEPYQVKQVPALAAVEREKLLRPKAKKEANMSLPLKDLTEDVLDIPTFLCRQAD
jgi:hypothetical protein